MSFERERAYIEFIGRIATEDDGGWSKEVWDAAWHGGHAEAWNSHVQEINSLKERIKLLEEEVAFVEHGYAKGEKK